MERLATEMKHAMAIFWKSKSWDFDPEELKTPPDIKMGLFAYPCFRLAKLLKTSPQSLAAQIAGPLEKILHLQYPDRQSYQCQAVGPYVNIQAKGEIFTQEILEQILDVGLNSVDSDERLKETNYGAWTGAPNRSKWVIEYSSPNVAKPLNIYHLRPTALGAALARIGRFRGHEVVSINHLGDWGKQYGLLAVAFKYFGIEPSLKMEMTELVDLYVKINLAAEQDPSIQDQARLAFRKLEQGDPEITRIWKLCVQISHDDFTRMYSLLGVKFDYIWGESHYKDQLPELLERLRKDGLLKESQGAWIVPLEDDGGNEMPPCLLEKSDGATLYATRDLAAALTRHETFKFNRMTYIVGQEQQLHFRQIFGVLKKMGLQWAHSLEHLPTGLYRLRDAKMSTRKGNFITLESVFEDTKAAVQELQKIRGKKGTLEDIEKIALGALIFYDLHSDPTRDLDFKLESVVDFEGETGPYLQYAHTRCMSLMHKAGVTIQWNPKLAKFLSSNEEQELIVSLAKFPLTLERVLKNAKASFLAQELIQISKHFNQFYKAHSVLGQDEHHSADLKMARLCLVQATQLILNKGLSLLGIPLPKAM